MLLSFRQFIESEDWKPQPWIERLNDLRMDGKSNAEIMAVIRREFPDKAEAAQRRLASEDQADQNERDRKARGSEKSAGHVGFVDDDDMIRKEVIKRGNQYLWTNASRPVRNGSREDWQKVTARTLSKLGFVLQ